ncbi:MAG: CopD family protein [Candidatus Porifericomitaceae bacterium WSBS_2022_MAG_OTU9]
MLWIKALHIVFAIAWLAGLLYLPRLFVYHAECNDAPGHERFLIMERRLYYGIMAPAGILTILFGGIMLWQYALEAYGDQWWLWLKLLLLAALAAHHLYCGYYVSRFRNGKPLPSALFFRWFNEIPAMLMVGIVILATVRPF